MPARSDRSTAVIWIAAVLAAGALGVYFRLYPLTVFPHDLSQNNAKLLVASNLRKSAAEKIRQSNPGLRAAEVQNKAAMAAVRKIQTDPAGFKDLVRRQGRALERELRTATRGGFLLEVDPYYYLSQTERILRQGRLAEPGRTRGREFLNPMTLAPDGYWYPMDLHPYLGAALFAIVSAAIPGVSVVDVVRWVPVLAALAALAVFAWYCRRVIGITGWAGFAGMTFLMLCPMFLKRSLAGWYDTDPYNVLFPLSAIAGLFAAYGPRRTARGRWIGAGVAGLSFSLHALFWRGWLTPFLVMVLFMLLGALIPRSRRPEGLTRRFHLLLLIPVVLLPFAAVAGVWGVTGVTQELTSAGDFIRGFLAPEFRPWPDVFITVGELKPMDVVRLTQLLGGPFWVLLVIAGLTLRLARRLRTAEPATAEAIPLCLLFGVIIVGLVVSVRIQRFAILTAAPLAAAVPFAWSEWRERLTAFWPRLLAPHAARAVLARNGAVWTGVTLAVVALLCVRAHAETVHFYPLYNPAWDRMMKQVRERTPENAIITSWWSPGHFLTGMGQRRVTFDGSSQNVPQAYWVANLFIQESETEALGILRMLNTSGNRSVEFLQKRGLSLSESVDLVRSIVPLSREAAASKLLRRFSRPDSDALLDLTHGRGTLPPSYLFVYNHMIEQALALEFVGRWNFRKAEAFSSYFKDQPKEVDRRLLTRATPQNTGLLWAMSERPSYYQTEGHEVAREGSTVLFSNGVRVDLDTHQALIGGRSAVKGRPSSVFWVNANNEWIETPVPGAELTVSVLLIDDPGKDGKTVYRSVVLGRRFAGSIAMRLYYFGGRGLRCIRTAAAEDSPADRTRLGLFEVDWKRWDAVSKGSAQD